VQKLKTWLTKHPAQVITVALFCAALFLSTYRLTESPPTWLDEGMIIQTSKTLVEEGVYAVKVAPESYISPGFISTSYPVTFPVALSFKLFGIGLLQARSVMVVYIMAFLLAFYFLGRRLFQNEWLAAGALALLVSFPPLYGNGKNVLGEVPGLFFLTAFLLFLDRIWKGDRRISQFVLCGLMLGLCIATKPIFILLAPVAGILLFYVWIKKPEIFGRGIVKNSFYLIICAAIPLVVWVMIQFRGDSLASILSYYANPHNVNVATSLLSNIKAFLTSPQSLYFFILYLIWLVAFAFRIRSKRNIEVSEWVAFGFSTLVLLAYFRNPAYYRYFFLAEIYALFFFGQSLNFIIGTPPNASVSGARAPIAFIVLIVIAFQTYQLFFSSWVAQYYGSTKTRDCEAAIGAISPSKSIFFYQDPELVIFRGGGNYYQYMDSIETDKSRAEKREVIANGVPDYFIASSETLPSLKSILGKYVQGGSCERYQIFHANL